LITSAEGDFEMDSLMFLGFLGIVVGGLVSAYGLALYNGPMFAGLMIPVAVIVVLTFAMLDNSENWGDSGASRFLRKAIWWPLVLVFIVSVVFLVLLVFASFFEQRFLLLFWLLCLAWAGGSVFLYSWEGDTFSTPKLVESCLVFCLALNPFITVSYQHNQSQLERDEFLYKEMKISLKDDGLIEIALPEEILLQSAGYLADVLEIYIGEERYPWRDERFLYREGKMVSCRFNPPKSLGSVKSVRLIFLHYWWNFTKEVKVSPQS
jgi:hypothetical protein